MYFLCHEENITKYVVNVVVSNIGVEHCITLVYYYVKILFFYYIFEYKRALYEAIFFVHRILRHVDNMRILFTIFKIKNLCYVIKMAQKERIAIECMCFTVIVPYRQQIAHNIVYLKLSLYVQLNPPI